MVQFGSNAKAIEMSIKKTGKTKAKPEYATFLSRLMRWNLVN